MVIGYFVFGISVISLISVQTSATNRIIPYIKLVINLNTDYNIITTTSYIFNCLSFQTVIIALGTRTSKDCPTSHS